MTPRIPKDRVGNIIIFNLHALPYFVISFPFFVIDICFSYRQLWSLVTAHGCMCNVVRLYKPQLERMERHVE